MDVRCKPTYRSETPPHLYQQEKLGRKPLCSTPQKPYLIVPSISSHPLGITDLPQLHLSLSLSFFNPQPTMASTLDTPNFPLMRVQPPKMTPSTTTTTTTIAEIARVLKLERYYRDTAQWEACRSTFHPDSKATYINVAWYVKKIPPPPPPLFFLIHPRYEGPIDPFLTHSSNAFPGYINILHSSFDPVHIQVNSSEDRATSDAFCIITSFITIDGIEYELASYVRLASRLMREVESGDWKILSLEAIYVRDRIVETWPGGLRKEGKGGLVVAEEEFNKFPKSYRCLAFVMAQRGLSPRMGLPNEGDRGSVEGVLGRNREWLWSVGTMELDFRKG